MFETTKIFIENILTTPAIMLDAYGRLVYSNSKAKAFNFNCPIGEEFINVAVSGKKDLSEIILSTMDSDTPKSAIIELSYEGKISVWNVQAKRIKLEENGFIIVSFSKANENSENAALHLNFNEKEISNYLTSENIKQVLDKVKNSFPFTFIGRQKFIREIDAMDEIIWLRDSEGKFLLTNKKFNLVFGMNANQIQNKFSRDIFPSGAVEAMNLVDRYLLKSNKAISFSLPTKVDGEISTNFIQVPLLDIDKKIVVIVGVSFKAVRNIGIQLDYEKISKLSDENSFVVNNEMKLEKHSDSFYKLLVELFGLDFENAFEIFNKDYLQKGLNILSNSFQEKFIKENILNIESRNFDLYLSKILEKNEIVGYYGYLKESSFYDQQKEMKVKMYDTIIHTSPQPIFIYDVENLKFLDVNQAALKMYGYLREEFLEKDLTDLYMPEDIQTLIESSTSPTISSDFTGPWRHKHKSGVTIYVELSRTQIELKDKKAHFIIIKDVTKQLGNDLEIKKLSFAVKNSEQIIVMTDADGFISDSSDSALTFFAFSPSDYNTKSFLSLIGDDDRAKINAEIFHSNVKDIIKVNTKLRRQSETSSMAEIIAQPILNYEKQTEAFSIIIKPEMKKEVAIEKVEVTKAAGGLDASFLSNLFHELLTPINVMIGFIQDITENLENPTHEQQEGIDIIKENQQMLLQIIDNAVEFSNIEQNKIELNAEKIVFIDLLEGIEESIRKIARNKKVDFNYGKISSSLRFTNDKQRISTFISLLTRFAIQITKKDKIYLSAYQRDDLKWIVSVRDDRNNISDELVKNFLRIINDDESELKHAFGISRFTIRLFRKLMTLLCGEPEVLRKYGDPLEYAIVFPYEISFKKKIEEHLEKNLLPSEEKSTFIEQEEMLPSEPILQGVKAENHIEIQVEEKITEKEILSQAEPTFKQVEKVINSIKQLEVVKEKPIEVIEEVKLSAAIEDKPKLVLKEIACLYLEDQVDSQILFKVQMKDLKSVDFAPSFEKALPLLQNNKYDFIVMDINLQGEYNGLDALRAIQKMKGFEHVPIIAATAYVLPGDRDRFVAAGFTDFITKPILKDKMENVLRKIFQ